MTYAPHKTDDWCYPTRRMRVGACVFLALSALQFFAGGLHRWVLRYDSYSFDRYLDAHHDGSFGKFLADNGIDDTILWPERFGENATHYPGENDDIEIGVYTRLKGAPNRIRPGEEIFANIKFSPKHHIDDFKIGLVQDGQTIPLSARPVKDEVHSGYVFDIDAFNVNTPAATFAYEITYRAQRAARFTAGLGHGRPTIHMEPVGGPMHADGRITVSIDHPPPDPERQRREFERYAEAQRDASPLPLRLVRLFGFDNYLVLYLYVLVLLGPLPHLLSSNEDKKIVEIDDKYFWTVFGGLFFLSFSCLKAQPFLLGGLATLGVIVLPLLLTLIWANTFTLSNRIIERRRGKHGRAGKLP